MLQWLYNARAVVIFLFLLINASHWPNVMVKPSGEQITSECLHGSSWKLIWNVDMMKLEADSLLNLV